MRKTNFLETIGLFLVNLALVAVPFGLPHPEVLALAGIGYVILGRR